MFGGLRGEVQTLVLPPADADPARLLLYPLIEPPNPIP
jgi:hypothetical protein